MPDLSQYEFYLTAASFLILGIYHFHWVYRIYRQPMTTSVGITNHLRGHWVESIMEERRDILAVQTLRTGQWPPVSWPLPASYLSGAAQRRRQPAKNRRDHPGLNELVREHRALWLFN